MNRIGQKRICSIPNAVSIIMEHQGIFPIVSGCIPVPSADRPPKCIDSNVEARKCIACEFGHQKENAYMVEE